MMNDKRYYTDFWMCSCNKKNHLFNRKCTKCNEDIPTELLGAIYFDEINQQNITYEAEEKKIKIVLGVIGIVVLPFVMENLSLILYLIGLLVLFIILLFGMIAGGVYVSYNIRCVLKKSNYSYEGIRIRIAYISMLIAFMLVLLMSDRWDGLVKALLAVVSLANIIMGIKLKLTDDTNRKTVNSITVQTILMVILAVLL